MYQMEAVVLYCLGVYLYAHVINVGIAVKGADMGVMRVNMSVMGVDIGVKGVGMGVIGVGIAVRSSNKGVRVLADV
ncbi:hypothetical protein Peur_029204 [Populus x canadensis]